VTGYPSDGSTNGGKERRECLEMKPSAFDRDERTAWMHAENGSQFLKHSLLISFMAPGVEMSHDRSSSFAFPPPSGIAELSRRSLNLFSSFVIVEAIAQAIAKRFQASASLSFPCVKTKKVEGKMRQARAVLPHSARSLHLSRSYFPLRLPFSDVSRHHDKEHCHPFVDRTSPNSQPTGHGAGTIR